MKFRTVSLLALFVIVLFPFQLFSQQQKEKEEEKEVPENKIEEALKSMLDNHPYKLGIVRFAPKLFAGSGYDTNTLSASVDQQIPDTYMSATPGGSFGIKFGTKAFLEVDEDLSFVYYHELEQLRDIFNTTEARFVTGNRRLLFDLDAKYIDKKARVSFEFDEPVQQKITDGNAGLIFGFTRTTDLRFVFTKSQYLYEEIKDLETDLEIPPGNRRTQYNPGVTQNVGKKFQFTFDGYFGDWEFLVKDAPPEEDLVSEFWEFLVGTGITEGDFIGSSIKVGYGETDSRGEQGKFQDVLLDADITYEIKPEWTIGGLASRERRVSALIQDSFYVALQFGLKSSIPLGKKMDFDIFLLFGKNDYGDSFFLNDEPVTKDQYYQINVGLGINLPKDFVLRPNVLYLDRDSDADFLNKDRFLIGVSLELAGS